MRIYLLVSSLVCGLVFSSVAAEKVFEFDAALAGQTPAGFTNLLLGGGAPGVWKVVMEEVAPLLPRLSDKAPVVTRRPVLAQLSSEAIDERFPILLFTGDTYRDFKLTTRFKLVSGKLEQMAGIVFRATDEKNFYIIRASGLGRNVKFYKVVNGIRSEPIGREMELAGGEWHELRIECQANQIRCALDGKDVFPPLIDNTFNVGRIGFWTKSDSVSYFTDTRLTYKPRIPFAQTLVNETVATQSRLKGLRIYTGNEAGLPKVVASKVAAEVGNAGGATEQAALQKGTVYFGRTKSTAQLVIPLRDRNGDPIAAVWMEMESFRGQTEQNALSRGMPIVKTMQDRVQTLAELLD